MTRLFLRAGARRLAGFCVLAVVLGTGLAAADPAPAARFTNAREQRDNAEVTSAESAMKTGGAGALSAHVPALEEVLQHAPRKFKKVERAGGEIDYRAESRTDFLGFSAWAMARAKARGEAPPTVIWLPDIYPTASFLLGWYYNDVKQPDKAIAALDRGLAIAPEEARLIGEKGQSLIALRRLDVALELYDRTLSGDGYLGDLSRALLLRAKGFCLTELKRYDEADKAYRDSLVLEPDHAGAKNERAYIARMQAGATPTAPQMTTYDRAKQGPRPGQ